MRELRNGKGRPGKSRRVVRIAAALLGPAVHCQPDLAHAARGAEGTGAEGVPRWTLPRRRIWRFTAAVSTPARTMGAAFTEPVSTAASRACTTASPAGTRATGTMAGAAGATAGGGPLPDCRPRTMIIRGGALIQIMTTTITVSLTPTKPGTIAPIRQVIIRMYAVQHRLAGGSSQLMPSDLTRLPSRQPG